jgi:hypothetical protein
MPHATRPLQDPEERIEQRQSHLVRERDRPSDEVTSVAGSVKEEADALWSVAADLFEELTGLADAMRGLAETARMESLPIDPRQLPQWTIGKTLVEGHARLAHSALQKLGPVQQRALATLQRLDELRAHRVELADQRDPALEFIRAQQAAHAHAPPEPTTHELKAIREAIQRDEWADLPAYYGSGAAPSRECQTCAGAVPPGLRRFCSRECRVAYADIYGTPAMPKKAQGSE